VRPKPTIALLATLLAACATAPPDVVEPAWIPLFDGQTLAGWEAIDYGIQGKCEVVGGALHVHMGESVSGVRYTGDLGEIMPPGQDGYELRLEAMRVDGFDFFCGLTFPVGLEGHVSLICGGWGGAVVGISCLDGWDASENETTSYRGFKPNRWYAIRVRVTRDRIECFIDDEQVVDVERAKYEELEVRAEMREYLPLGLSTFQTHAALRNVEIRSLGN